MSVFLIIVINFYHQLKCGTILKKKINNNKNTGCEICNMIQNTVEYRYLL